jgi:DNA-binding NarL/FixJ family response regulator
MPPPTPSPITVAIARFDDLLALGLRALLTDDPAVSIVAEGVEHERLSVILRAHHPRVLIIDAGRLRDLAQVRELSVEHPHTRLVVFTDGLPAAEAAQLLAFGASACLARNTQARDVRNTLYLTSRGMQVAPRSANDASGARAGDPLLTQREGDVIGLLRQGQGNAQIALELQIGVETVRTHARNIYRKLGVTSRRALIALPTPAAEPPTPRPPGPVRHRVASRKFKRRPMPN